MGSTTMTPGDSSAPGTSSIRKRVRQACDRCRLKKSKCDGSSPCSRCRADQAICVFSERTKSQDKVYSNGYIEMLENQQTQLVAGLQELYRRLQTGEHWVGSPLKESTQGQPLIHDILARLGALKQNSKVEIAHFVDDSKISRDMPFVDGADTMQPEHSFDINSAIGQMSTFEMGALQGVSSDPSSLAGSHSPSTPPVGGPYQYTMRTSCPLKAEALTSTTTIPNQEPWQMYPLGFSGMGYHPAHEPPIREAAQMQTLAFTQQTYTSATIGASNPCPASKRWPPYAAVNYRAVRNHPDCASRNHTGSKGTIEASTHHDMGRLISAEAATEFSMPPCTYPRCETLSAHCTS